MKNRTVIIIAHRLSTVRDADVIAVCSKGRVISSGRHDELLSTCTMYANLVRKQLSSAADSEHLERYSSANALTEENSS
jgi:ABC-type multidrug transport system fused ATPase/permease subunit